MKIYFGVTPPPKKNGGRTTFFWSKIKKNQSCSKLAEMARKLVEKVFLPPLTKKNRVPKQKQIVKHEKNQSCSKLAEMARKLVKNDLFLTFQLPPKNNLGGVQIFFFKNGENKIKVVQNWLKWQENWSKIIFFDF